MYAFLEKIDYRKPKDNPIAAHLLLLTSRGFLHPFLRNSNPPKGPRERVGNFNYR
jgi:hypothetical protein